MKTGVHIVREALANRVDAPVVHKIPAERPQVFVRVDFAAVSHPTPATTETAMIVQAYGSARLAWGLLKHVADLELQEEVYGVESINGPYRFDDQNGVERYQLTFNLIHSGLEFF